MTSAHSDDRPGLVRLGSLVIDLDGHLISYPDGRDTTLTLRQRDLLRVLIHSRGRTLSYADLGLEAWHYPERYYSEGGIRLCICRLRRKLGRAASVIQTVHTIGYRFVVLSDSDEHQEQDHAVTS